MSDNLKHFIEKTRIDDKREHAIQAAKADQGFRTRADAIRWLLGKGAMHEGYWPDANAPTMHTAGGREFLVDPRVEYVAGQEDE